MNKIKFAHAACSPSCNILGGPEIIHAGHKHNFQANVHKMAEGWLLLAGKVMLVTDAV